MRRSIRKWISWLWKGATAIFITAVVGEGFVRIAEKLGVYDEPLGLLESFVNLIWAFVTQTWFLMLYSFILGLALGVGLDRFHFRKNARTDAIKALIDLRATGVNRRNAHCRHIADLDYQGERNFLRDWTIDVLLQLEDAGVDLATQSDFRILGEFVPRTIGEPGRTEPQVQLEAIWNEKLGQLKAIIADVGG